MCFLGTHLRYWSESFVLFNNILCSFKDLWGFILILSYQNILRIRNIILIKFCWHRGHNIEMTIYRRWLVVSWRNNLSPRSLPQITFYPHIVDNVALALQRFLDYELLCGVIVLLDVGALSILKLRRCLHCTIKHTLHWRFTVDDLDGSSIIVGCPIQRHGVDGGRRHEFTMWYVQSAIRVPRKPLLMLYVATVAELLIDYILIAHNDSRDSTLYNN